MSVGKCSRLVVINKGVFFSKPMSLSSVFTKNKENAVHITSILRNISVHMIVFMPETIKFPNDRRWFTASAAPCAFPFQNKSPDAHAAL